MSMQQTLTVQLSQRQLAARRRWAAYHEAGHAVMRVLLHVPTATEIGEHGDGLS